MSEEIARLLQQGIAAARAGDKDLAKRMLIEVTERDQHNEQAWLWLSGVVDDLEETRICLENVVAINPANERARQGLAWVQSRLAERPPEMPPSIEEQIAAPAMPPPAAPVEEPEPAEDRVPCPACGAMNFDFATECVKCGFPFAITCPRCSELVPTETGLCPNCGADLPLPRKMAGVQAREAATEDSFRQGLTHLEEGRYQEAKAAFEQAIGRDPQHVEAYYSLGVACAKLGLREEARQYWEMVKQLQPDHPYVQQELASLLSPRERRQLARERQKAGQEAQKKRKQTSARPEGQTLIYEYEKKIVEKPAPEEEVGGLESFLYVLMVGVVIGVAYALNPQAYGTRLARENVPAILEMSGAITAMVFSLWLILTITSRLLSRIFKASGSTPAYLACSSHFLMPFFLLILPIVLNVPQIASRLPARVRSILELSWWQLPSLPWIVFGGLALFWGLFSFVRGISRVGKIALWKAMVVGLVAVAVSLAAVGGAVYGIVRLTKGKNLLEMLGLKQLLSRPTPTPGATPSPSPGTTPAP